MKISACKQIVYYTASLVILFACRKDLPLEKNIAPVANAGRDTTIVLPPDSLVLDGTASHHPDGNIRSYSWRNISPLPCSISNQEAAKATVKNLITGIYKFELQVTDEQALTSKDTVVVTVQSRPPVAKAGPDQTITLPANTVMLDGSKSFDSSGAPISFLWKQLSGEQSIISSSTTAFTEVLFSSPGVFRFELQVLNRNGWALDTVVVTVLHYNCNVSRQPLSAQLNYLSPLPAPHDEERRMVAYGNKLYFPVLSHKVLNIYDVISGNWSSAPLPADQFEGRTGIAMVAAGNKIFFAGGHAYDVWGIWPSNLVNIYDINTNTWSISQLSEARGYIKAAVAGDKVVFAGGYNEDQRVYSKTVDIYDLRMNTWNKAEMKGLPRAVGAAVTAGNKIFFIAGYTGFVSGPMWDIMGKPVKDIDIYDANSGQWTTTALQLPRENFAAVAGGDKIYIAGGSIGQSGSYLVADVEVINVHTLSKTNTCLAQPTAFYTQSAISMIHHIAFFVGQYKVDVYNTVSGEWLQADLPAGTGMNPRMAEVQGEIYILDDPHPNTASRLFKLKL